MSQEFIEIGTGEQTGDGESLRSAFIKINNNFSDVYTIMATEGNRAFVSEDLPPGAVDGNFWLDRNTGRLYINVDSQWISPVISLVPNQSWDPSIGSNASVSVAGIPPASATEGSIWLNNTDGSLYVKLGDAWMQPYTGAITAPAEYTGNSNAWNIPAPTTISEAIDRMANFLYARMNERF